MSYGLFAAIISYLSVGLTMFAAMTIFIDKKEFRDLIEREPRVPALMLVGVAAVAWPYCVYRAWMNAGMSLTGAEYWRVVVSRGIARAQSELAAR